MTRTLRIDIERWPVAGVFTIARGSRTESIVVTATVTEGALSGRGEGYPLPRYNQTPESTAADIERCRAGIERGAGRQELLGLLPASAARNALDCALFDLEAKAAGRRAWEIAGLPAPKAVVTAYTISLGEPQAMAAAAKAAARPLLKIKLGGSDGRDGERISAIRAAAPAARLIVDANEGWREASLEGNLAACAAAGVELVEQPLPAGSDAILAAIRRPLPLCADESVHDRSTLPQLKGRYDAVNIKLDKTGGLTEALALADAARALGFKLMIGCMVGTSLAMAPALIAAADAEYIDLDGPLLLAKDREPGLRYEGSLVHPPEPELWG